MPEPPRAVTTDPAAETTHWGSSNKEQCPSGCRGWTWFSPTTDTVSLEQPTIARCFARVPQPPPPTVPRPWRPSWRSLTIEPWDLRQPGANYWPPFSLHEGSLSLGRLSTDVNHAPRAQGYVSVTKNDECPVVAGFDYNRRHWQQKTRPWGDRVSKTGTTSQASRPLNINNGWAVCRINVNSGGLNNRS